MLVDTAAPEVSPKIKSTVASLLVLYGMTGFSGLLAELGTSTVVFNTLDTACLFLSLDVDESRLAIEQLRAQLRSGG